ncbi:hypothetical protein DVH24_034406 [Malus domestica]|uniref:Protein kinase domain-containing protein n=1 Tax=Malus domestica TaxID=3750 RepID=A0A498IWB2_MALDO|nr:hypothetical protein DVH24_034406 [Malus domestica]
MQSHVEDDLKGTLGYLDPSYMKSGYITQKSDVYSFGVHLLVFLTGQKVVDKYDTGEYQSIIAYVKLHVNNVGEDEKVKQQLQDFLQLALSCTRGEIERRPYMSDVASELLCISNSAFHKHIMRRDLTPAVFSWTMTLGFLDGRSIIMKYFTGIFPNVNMAGSQGYL